MINNAKNSLQPSIDVFNHVDTHHLSPVTDGDSSASAGAAWLHDPEVEETIHLQLSRTSLAQLLQSLYVC